MVSPSVEPCARRRAISEGEIEPVVARNAGSRAIMNASATPIHNKRRYPLPIDADRRS